MKKILNRILAFSFIFVLLSVFPSSVYSINTIKEDKMLKIYDIKEKEEVLVENNKVIDFYEESHEEFEAIIEQEKLDYKIRIVEFAKQFVGNPYVLGGNSLTNGTDCSGFVKLVYANFGITLPRGSYDQAKVGEYVNISDIEVGDIVSYTFDGINPGHSALYIGDGLIVHASVPELGIRIDSLYSMPIYGVRRVI